MRTTLTALAAAGLAAAATGLLGVTPAAAGGGGKCHAEVSMESGITRVVDDHVCWSPVVGQVAVGQTVTFVNQTGLQHNITGPGPFGYHEFGAGDTVQIAFATPGIYPYACTFHPGMSGAIVVGNPLGDAPAPVAPAAASTPAVSLSTSDASDGGSLLGTTPRIIGTGAAAAGAAGVGAFLVVRRRRTALPTV